MAIESGKGGAHQANRAFTDLGQDCCLYLEKEKCPENVKQGSGVIACTLGKDPPDVEWKKNYRAKKGSRETHKMMGGVFQDSGELGGGATGEGERYQQSPRRES